MDIIAHALWANAARQGITRATGRPMRNKDLWIPMFFGIFPDLFSFGPFFVENIISRGFGNGGFVDHIPAYVNTFYDLTHSLVIFSIVFAIVAIIRKKIYWPLAGWALHIGIDIFSHSMQFFPTPILYPVSDFKLAGVSWANPDFMAINYSALAATYIYLVVTRKKGTGYFDENK